MTALADQYTAIPWQTKVNLNWVSTTHYWGALGQNIKSLWASIPSSMTRDDVPVYYGSLFWLFGGLSERMYLKILAQC